MRSEAIPKDTVSENGPREGTRDLPRPSPEAGRRAVDKDSAAGSVYGSLARSRRRRRSELVALLESTGSPTGAVEAYHARHPLEPRVSNAEIEAALAAAERVPSRKVRPAV